MPSMKFIKRRIASVGNTKQIVKAMHLVSASKLQKYKNRLDTTRPLFNETKRVIDRIKGCEAAADNIFFKTREVKNRAFVVITSDKGLCGSYNTNLLKKAMALIDMGENEKIIAVGAKGREYFRRRKRNILRKYTGIIETAFYEDAEEIGDMLTSLYLSGGVDEVYVAYTYFGSMLSLEPRVERIFPVDTGAGAAGGLDITECDPDINTLLNHAAPMYLNAFIYGAMAEASACEQAARMLGMDSAENNAADIIDDLALAYNRMRQGAITQEINEIVSGANALK